MNSATVNGPQDNSNILRQTLGKIIYDSLVNKSSNQITLIESNTAEEISYGKLLERSVKVSLSLRRLGLQKGDIITILSHNQWAYLSVVFAAFFAGIKINLLNPEYTNHELRQLFSTCHPNVIFCSAQILHKVLALHIEFAFKKILVFDQMILPAGLESYTDLLLGVTAYEDFQPVTGDINDPILMLPSSGTTITPKQVLLSHTNIRNGLLCMSDPQFFSMTSGQTTIGYTPFFDSFGFLVALTSVLQSVKLVIMNKFTPDTFLKIIQDYRVGQLFIVPPIMELLAKSPLIDRYNTSSLEDVVDTSARLTEELRQTIEQKLNCKVRQAYGMAEASGTVAISPRNASKCGSVGKIIANTSLKICDPETGTILGPNQWGEICIKGEGVMMGYCGNQTTSFDEEGFWKTGDLGFYDKDNHIYVIGRLEEINKHRGFQILPREIEAVLKKHPAVKEAAVIGIENKASCQIPLALIVRQPNKFVAESEIIQFVKKHVHMKIRDVKFLTEIPKQFKEQISRKKLKTAANQISKL